MISISDSPHQDRAQLLLSPVAQASNNRVLTRTCLKTTTSLIWNGAAFGCLAQQALALLRRQMGFDLWMHLSALKLLNGGSQLICDELVSLLLKPLSGEESKPFELDGYTQRRANEKEVLKSVNTKEEVLVTAQLRIIAIASSLVYLYAPVSLLLVGEKLKS
ncbi:hypothetical protein OUZ56_010296 [Daphnia magna]|uniref:Uncharacterized protein n=1 Tax=Daphnia magna TaxID=35525 RepID=A0ABR0AI48_9CRUS|nr:hypothetical protein OUZ56_010296 [Daphnia magna]